MEKRNRILLALCVAAIVVDMAMIVCRWVKVNNDLAETKTKLAQVETERDEAQDQMGEALATLVQMQRQLDVSNAKIDELEAKVAELEAARVILSENEEEILLKIAKVEANGQGVAGKAHVMRVVLNRKDHLTKYPDTIEGVVYQSGQFTPVASGSFNAAVPDKECYEALRAVEAGWDHTMGATSFRSGNYHSYGTPLYQYKDHYFSK